MQSNRLPVMGRKVKSAVHLADKNMDDLVLCKDALQLARHRRACWLIAMAAH
ncbi:MAG: hypothetical protein ACETVZ_03410 [Phycisphaerae bacterium]